MKIYDTVRYTGENNEVNNLKNGDIGAVILDYSDGYFEIEFLDSEGITKVIEVINEEFLEKV